MDVSPKLRWNFFNSWRRWILTFASKADRGSSKSNKFGDVAMARANAILCCSPPDNWLGYFAEWSESPTKSSRLSTLFSISTFVHAAFRRPYAMFSKQERLGKSAYDWKTMPKSRWEVGRLEISLPFWNIFPLDCSSSPAIQRKRVVFPQPDGPKKQTNSPSFIEIEMSFKALKLPKYLDKF